MTQSLKTIAFIPKPGVFHPETLRERKALMAKTSAGDQIAVAWCWRNSVGGFYHAGARAWAVYSGPQFSLSDFLAHLESSGVILPEHDVVTAWCLSVREPLGRAH